MTASDDRGKNKIAPATSLGGAPPQGFADDGAHGRINTMARPSRQAGIAVMRLMIWPCRTYVLVLKDDEFRRIQPRYGRRAMAVAGGCGNMSGCGSRLPHEMPDARGSFPFGRGHERKLQAGFGNLPLVGQRGYVADQRLKSSAKIMPDDFQSKPSRWA
jgi:hypothetical protein